MSDWPRFCLQLIIWPLLPDSPWHLHEDISFQKPWKPCRHTPPLSVIAHKWLVCFAFAYRLAASFPSCTRKTETWKRCVVGPEPFYSLYRVPEEAGNKMAEWQSNFSIWSVRLYFINTVEFFPSAPHYLCTGICFSWCCIYLTVRSFLEGWGGGSNEVALM